MKKNGYTLIEILAVMSILIVIMGVIVGILYSTLRGTSKTKVTTEVTQSGSYAVSLFSREVHDSRNVLAVGTSQIPDDINDCTGDPPPSGTSITLRKINNDTVTFACQDVDVDGVPTYVLTEQENDGEPESIINTSFLKVAAGSCSFTCDQSVGDLYAFPIIKFKFGLIDKNLDDDSLQETSIFQASVSLNNYLP